MSPLCQLSSLQGLLCVVISLHLILLGPPFAKAAWVSQPEVRASIWKLPSHQKTIVSLAARRSESSEHDSLQAFADRNRRKLWAKTATQLASVGLIGAAAIAWTRPAWSTPRSRTKGYKVQKSEEEWKAQLSSLQYNILRQGGTERPYFSILEGEERTGVYKCAACETELFASSDKFHSGTGWPSFARGLPGVEIESVDPITANFAGAELRCRTCGGHLGDVFQDGFLFLGTEAFKTGKRFCIDGAALVFLPSEADGGGDPVRGDIQAKKSK